MSIDKATVRKIATLARIDVPEEDVGAVAEQLSGIFGWIEQLKEVDTDNVAPMSGGTDLKAGGLKLAWRKDAVADGGHPDKILANAPDAHDAFFAVPKVVE